MAEDRIRGDQDDFDVDESISEGDGGIAEMPEALDDEDDDFEDEDD